MNNISQKYLVNTTETHNDYRIRRLRSLVRDGGGIEKLHYERRVYFYYQDKPPLFISEAAHDDILVLATAYVDARTASNKTLLHLSAETGDKELVDVFITAGADVDTKDEDKRAPLHLSSWFGHTNIVEILLKAGAYVDAVNKYNETPLHLCAQKGHINIVNILIKAGANVDATNRYNDTPLHLSSQKGHKEIVESLIKAGAKVDAENNYNETPLHLSSQNGHKEIVESLIKAGANVDAENSCKSTPLHLSVQNHHENVIDILLIAGASTKKKDIHEYSALDYLDFKLLQHNNNTPGKLPKMITWLFPVPSDLISAMNSALTTKTISATFTGLESMNITSELRAHLEDQDDISKDRSSALLNYGTAVTSSGGAGWLGTPNLPAQTIDLGGMGAHEQDTFRQQVENHWAMFSPENKEGWQTRCSHDVKAAMLDGRIVMNTVINITNNIVNNFSHVDLVPVNSSVVVRQTSKSRRKEICDNYDSGDDDNSDD